MAARKKSGVLTPEAIRDAINQDFPGAIRLASEEYFKIKWVPTGVLAFDRLTGGGIPLGRYTEIYGQESTLKSVMASIAVAKFQQEFPERRCMWINSEQSFDKDWVARWGVDLDNLDVVSPDTGEQSTRILEMGMLSRGYSLFVVDSIAALAPQREIEYEAEDTAKAMGASGRMTSQMMRRLTRLNQNDSAVLLINQTRDRLGVMFGDPSAPTGGRAIPFYAGLRIEARKGETINKEYKIMVVGGKESKRKVAESRVVTFRVIKDKVGPHEGKVQQVLWDPINGRFDVSESLLLLGIQDGYVKRSGTSVRFSFGSKKKKVEHSVSGWGAAKTYLTQNPKAADKLERLIAKNTISSGR